MQPQPVLSVIIPTCDRPGTLRHALATVLRQPQAEIEIIVSDNAGGPDTRRVVEEVSDSRLRYLRVDERLGMSEHWEFALGHARGEWITVVGDDDGVLPGGLARFFGMIAAHEIEAVSTATCSFVWPGGSGDCGDLMVRGGRGFEVVESAPALALCLRNQCSYKRLPWIYTGGFVKRSAIDRVMARSGRFFSSIIPDVYSGIAIASVLPRFGFSDVPCTIEGTSRHSNGATCARAWRDKGAAPKFFTEGTMRFHASLGTGFVPSIPLMVYESFLQSRMLRDQPIESSMEEQLEIALLAAKKGQWDHTLHYCEDLAAMNGVDLGPILRRVKPRRLAARVGKMLRQVLPVRAKVDLEIARASDPALANIHDAARRAEELLAGRVI